MNQIPSDEEDAALRVGLLASGGDEKERDLYNQAALKLYEYIYKQCHYFSNKTSIKLPEDQWADVAQIAVIETIIRLRNKEKTIDSTVFSFACGVANRQYRRLLGGINTPINLESSHLIDEQSDPAAIFELEDIPTPDALLLRIIFVSRMHLRVDNRMIFDLFVIDKVSQAAIAEQFAMSEEAIKMRFLRAKVRINQVLNRCLNKLLVFRHMLFYLQYDRSPKSTKNNTDQAAASPPNPIRRRYVTDVLTDLRAALAAIRAGEAPQLPLHDAKPLQLDWSQVQAPEPLTLDVMQAELEATLQNLLDCVSSSSSLKGGN